ncbi:MAG: hypothetical protein SF069_11110 [Phycisphaerae bacterium]|nr:hypothetical protein [Phycisphaerae bacterium]
MHEPVQRVVRNAARDAVSRLVEVAQDPGRWTESAFEVMLEAGRQGTNIVPALVECLASSDFVTRYVSALHLRVSHSNGVLGVDPTTLNAANAVFLQGLASADLDERVFATALLCQAPVPDEAVPHLKELWLGGTAESRVFVAAALSQANPDTVEQFDIPLSEVYAVLSNALKSDDAVALRTASLAIGRAGVRAGKPSRILCEALANVGPGMKEAVLLGLKELGTIGVAGAQQIADIAANDQHSASLRALAVVTLGSVTRGTSKGYRTFDTALQSDDHRLILAGLVASIEAGHASPVAISLFAVHLRSADTRVRLYAAMALTAARGAALPALPILVERFREEKEYEVLERVCEAVAAIGAPALDDLLELIGRHDRDRMESCARTLVAIGPTAVDALVTAFLRTKDEWYGLTMLAVIEQLEQGQDKAVVSLARALERTNDEELALILTIGIEHAGPASLLAARPLIRWFVQGREELGYWVARALSHADKKAVAAVLANSEKLPSADRARLEAILEQRQASGHAPLDRFAKYREFPRQAVLWMFMRAAQVLLDRGPIPMKELAAVMNEIANDGADPFRTPTTQRAIELNINQFCEHFKITFRASSSGRPGPLTDAAAGHRSELEAYFAMGGRDT